MAHKFYYPVKDTWISELSSSVNYGYDEILELKKIFKTSSTSSLVEGVTRILLQFDLTDISKSIANPLIGSGEIENPSAAKYFLRLYSADSSHLSTTYSLTAFPLSQSWEEGSGKHLDDPIKQDGITWERRDHRDASTVWGVDSGKMHTGSRSSASGSSTNGSGSIYGGAWLTGSEGKEFACSQSFSYQSPDIEMDITHVVDKWISGSGQLGNIDNHGLIVMRSGSMNPVGEENDTSRQDLKFFSRNTNTIYSPKLELRWDDRFPITGEITSSFTALDMSGETDNYVYVKGIKPSYKETETVKFRVGARKRNITKTYSTSFQTITGSFIADTSGSYSILDVQTGEVVVPFGDYSLLSIDSSSMYFNQDLNGFDPNRFYKILFRVKYDDGQEVIYDDDEYQFKVVR